MTASRRGAVNGPIAWAALLAVLIPAAVLLFFPLLFPRVAREVVCEMLE